MVWGGKVTSRSRERGKDGERAVMVMVDKTQFEKPCSRK